MPTPIADLTIDELTSALVAFGVERYRARQVFHWVHRAKAAAFEEMTDLPATLRLDLLPRHFLARSLTPVRTLTSQDGLTAKHLLRLHDGQHIEAVEILEGREGGSLRRRTMAYERGDMAATF